MVLQRPVELAPFLGRQLGYGNLRSIKFQSSSDRSLASIFQRLVESAHVKMPAGEFSQRAKPKAEIPATLFGSSGVDLASCLEMWRDSST
jgi:hypothetical protein